MPPYRIQVAPRAQEQLALLSPLVSGVLAARLQRLARTAEVAGTRVQTGPHYLLGRSFRAIFEVDHESATVTVLDISRRD